MADFPTQLLHLPTVGSVGSTSIAAIVGDHVHLLAAAGAGAVWPSANRAIYVPIIIESYVTAFQMAFEVTTQSGNYDIGIYDELGTRLVNGGSTAVPGAGIATKDIADTALTPGTYWLALAIDNGTAAVQRHSMGTVASITAAGVQDQDTAFTLPATATFSAPGAVYVPVMVLATKSTI